MNIISYYKLLSFYNNIFSKKKLLKEFFNIYRNKHSSFPVTINMLITNKCNLSCKMCVYNNSHLNKKADVRDELTIYDINKFIHDVKKFNPVIHVGGGEPSIRRDLIDIIGTIKKNKLKCIVCTNGLLLNESIARKIINLKTDMLIFSLYGISNTHDSITGVAGSFDKTAENLKSILRIRREHTKIIASIVPMPENINTLKKLILDLHSYGVDRIKIEQLNFLNSEDSFDASVSAFLLNDHLYDFISKSYKDFVLIKPYLNKKQLSKWYLKIPARNPKCMFITNSVFINSNGDIMPCQFFPNHPLGNIKQDSLESVWTSDNYRKFREFISSRKPTICMRCCKN